MIILIGGVTRTGKTLMAQRIMERHNIPYISVDHIKMGLYRGLKNDKYHPEQDYEVLAEELWPVIKGIIMTAIENKQNLILEGCYILPHMADDFGREYVGEIISLALTFSDDYISRNYHSHIMGKQGVIEDRDTDHLESVGLLQEFHRELRRKCTGSLMECFEIKQDYDRETEAIHAWIGSKIQLFK